MKPAVSVIVPVLNGAATLPRLLSSLERQTYRGEWEVIVADNGSVDGTSNVAARWESRLPGFRVVYATARRGVSHARNAGAAAAGGRFLAFIDHDDEADPEWLRELVQAARSATMVAGRYDFKRLNDSVRRAWYGNRAHDRVPRALSFLPFASGGNLGIEAEGLRRIGGWDESLDFGGEDIDLSWRVQLAGDRLAFAPGAVVYKRHRSTLGALARQQFWYGAGGASLYRRHRVHLQPRALVSLRAWGYVALTSPDLLGPSDRRGRWVAVAAHQLGWVVGNVRHALRHEAGGGG